MIAWYKRLKPRYRILLHAACIAVVIAVPTIYGDRVVLPLLAAIIWSIGLFGECLLILINRKCRLDQGTSDRAALKRIEKMTPEERKKEREILLGKLNELAIPGPGIKLFDNEICLYKGEAEVIYDPDFLRYYLGDLCPEKLEEETKKSCPGLLYITTRRVIMESAFYSFKLDYPEILQAQHTGNVLLLLQKCDANEVYTRDLGKIIKVFNLLNQLSMTEEDDIEPQAIRDAI